MKLLISFWISCSILLHPQSDCKNFNTIFYKVDDNYSELSQNHFANFIKISAFDLDSIKIDLYNVDGQQVYQNYYVLNSSGKYIFKFFNPDCPGIYFCTIKVGNQPSYKKSVQITSEAFPSNEIETNFDTSTFIIDGIWKRKYYENSTPQIQPNSDLNKIEYHYEYDLQVQFYKGSYKISSERIDEDNGGKITKTYEGRFTLSADTLKLYEGSKLSRVFQYKIEEDTLSIFLFSNLNEKTGALEIQLEKNIYDTEIKLVGKYLK
jgi:hypothetical protein